MARSAVWAKCANELNSMWLPDRGSLHTVVLLTPGKCAARWICLSGLVMDPACRLGSGRGVAVGGAGQAEQAAQGAGLVARCGTRRGAAARAPGPRVIAARSCGDDAGPQPEARSARPAASPAAGRPAPPACRRRRARRWVLVRRPARPAGLARPRRGGRVVAEEHHQVAEDVQRSRRPARPRPAPPRISATIAAPRPASCGVTKPTSARRATSWYGHAAGAPSAATTGWPCGGRGVIDGPLTRELRPSKSM